jgi:hypothetical protein
LTIFGFLSFYSASEALAADEPDVSTENVSNVGTNNATLEGFADGNGLSTRVWFEYGTNRSMNDSTREKSHGSGSDDFSARISGLRANTVYYFRAVAKNREGTEYGNINSFITDYDSDYPYNQYPDYNYNPSTSSLAPTAITMPATNIVSGAAELNSLIISENSIANTWYEWGVTPNLGNKTITISTGTLPAIRHAHTLRGLVPGVTYYFRAVAENSSLRNIGVTLSFVAIGYGQSSNVIIKESTDTTNTTTKTDNTKTTETGSYLGANVLGAGFLPGSLLGWILLFILILLALLLVKYIWDKSPEQKHNNHLTNSH